MNWREPKRNQGRENSCFFTLLTLEVCIFLPVKVISNDFEPRVVENIEVHHI